MPTRLIKRWKRRVGALRGIVVAMCGRIKAMVPFFRGATEAAIILMVIFACGVDGDEWAIACIAEIVSVIMAVVFYKAAEWAADGDIVWR